MTTDYIVDCGFDTVRVRANLAEASCQIKLVHVGRDAWDEEEDVHSTPFQTADARHDEYRMALLVVRYLGPDWYDDGSGQTPEDVIRSVRAID